MAPLGRPLDDPLPDSTSCYNKDSDIPHQPGGCQSFSTNPRGVCFRGEGGAEGPDAKPIRDGMVVNIPPQCISGVCTKALCASSQA